MDEKSENRSLITHTIAGKKFSVPWDQWCFWKNYGPENYYLDEMLPFTAKLNQHFDFFDLGADVGTVSALINKYCNGLNRIIAVEPNPITFDVLIQNLQNISPKNITFNQAISNFNGFANFSFDENQGSDHEGHIVVDKSDYSQAKTVVNTLDSLVENNNLELHANIAIKIDIEGQEKEFFSGASHTIQVAEKVIILLELHPEVLARACQTPEEIFSEAEKLRSFQWLVPLLNNYKVDRTKPFFEQCPLQQYDVIGIAI